MQTIRGHFPPVGPAAAYKTYTIRAPIATHWSGIITCAEYECGAYLYGWDSFIDESTDQGQRQAHYIRKESGRRFTEERRDDGLTVFHFEAGQQGFASRVITEDHSRHRRRLDRQEQFIERGGDFRGNPTGQRHKHTRPDYWLESFALHQDKLRTIAERG